MTGVSGAPTQDDPPEALSGTPSIGHRLAVALMVPTMKAVARWAEWRDQRREAALYGECETLADLGKVTALWAEGEISYHPGGYDEGPAEETVELIPALATLNRAGFVTSGSQPGEGPGDSYDGQIYWQRAAVDGFTDTATADRLETACREAGLTFVRNGPARWRTNWKNCVPVTVTARNRDAAAPPSEGCLDADYWAHTGFGTHLSRRQVTFTFRGYASDALCAAEQVTVIDPVWGRQNVLWDTLTAAVTPPCCPCRGER